MAWSMVPVRAQTSRVMTTENAADIHMLFAMYLRSLCMSRLRSSGLWVWKKPAYTRAEAYDHEADGSGGAYSRQGMHSHELSDYDGIHHAVELLEHIAYEHGQGKGQYVAGDGAGGHVRDGAALVLFYLHLVLSIHFIHLFMPTDRSGAARPVKNS